MLSCKDDSCCKPSKEQDLETSADWRANLEALIGYDNWPLPQQVAEASTAGVGDSDSPPRCFISKEGAIGYIPVKVTSTVNDMTVHTGAMLDTGCSFESVMDIQQAAALCRTQGPITHCQAMSALPTKHFESDSELSRRVSIDSRSLLFKDQCLYSPRVLMIRKQSRMVLYVELGIIFLEMKNIL